VAFTSLWPNDAGHGCFGAALMRTPQVVGEMCTAIYDGMGIVPSVKCRLGIGEVAQYHLSTHNPSLIFELILLVRH
jgi:hypothetical protein